MEIKLIETHFKYKDIEQGQVFRSNYNTFIKTAEFALQGNGGCFNCINLQSGTISKVNDNDIVTLFNEAVLTLNHKSE